MTGITFQQPVMLAALLLVPALFLLFRYARQQRATFLELLGGQRSPDIAAAMRQRRQRESRVLVAVSLWVLALARPGNHPHLQPDLKGGRDVVFLLDVSRSMLATDTRPNRLERAKLDIGASLEARGNDRVGLVVFAGAAAIRSPVTSDDEFLRTMLQDANPNSVTVGSTYLQAALQKTVDQMLPKDRQGLQDVVLLTDGEDQGSHPEQTLAALNATGARLLVIGYGDSLLGARIPAGNDGKSSSDFIMDAGQEVWTKLREEPLRALAANANQGEYLRGGTAGFDLGRTYRQWSAKAPRQALPNNRTLTYDEPVAWLLVPALLLLLYPLPLAMRGRSAMALLLVGSLLAPTLHAEPAAPPPFPAGVALMKNGEFDAAAKAFDEAVAQAGGTRPCSVGLYNAALAHAQVAAHLEDPAAQLVALGEAIQRMRNALMMKPDWPAAGQGLEVLYFRRAAAQQALAERLDQLAKLNQQVDELIKELICLLDRQKQLEAATRTVQRDRATADDQKVERLQDLGSKQAAIGEETQSALVRMNQIDHKMRTLVSQAPPAGEATPPPPISTGFEEPLGHLTSARQSQNSAVESLGPILQAQVAWLAEKSAVEAITAAIKALSPKPQGEEADAAEDDEDWDDSDNPSGKSMAAEGDFVSDPMSRELPQPNFSAEDILQEEKNNAAVREKGKPARVGKGEKDW